MSWFQYGTPRRRSLRKNVWLRTRSLPADLERNLFKNIRRGEYLDRVIVHEIRPKDEVLLEVWSRRPWHPRKKERWTIHYHLCQENPDWVCEGDLGRGYKE